MRVILYCVCVCACVRACVCDAVVVVVFLQSTWSSDRQKDSSGRAQLDIHCHHRHHCLERLSQRYTIVINITLPLQPLLVFKDNMLLNQASLSLFDCV